MGHNSVWKILDEMIADFRRRRVDVPSEIVSNMKASKAIMRIVQNNIEHGQDLQKIEQYLGNVQIYLVSEGEKRFGQKYADKWLTRIDEASREVSHEEKEKKRFVPGLPRQQTWIRISPSPEFPLEKLRTLAQEENLTYAEQEGNILLVCGAEKNVKAFVKKVATERKLKTKKRH